MKKGLIFLFPSVLLLSSCLCGWGGVLPGPFEDSSSKEPSSSAPKALAPKELKYSVTENEKTFSLEEFPDISISIVSYTLYVGDTRVTERGISDGSVFAYDVNNDGFRDLIFNEEYEENGKDVIRTNGFDVHNMKKMVNTTYKYRLGLSIEGEKVKAQSYTASTGHKIIHDYADIAYSEGKGLYFIWDNIYQFKEFKFGGITKDDENKTPVNPENGKYTLKEQADYLFKISAPREDNPTIQELDFEHGPGFTVRFTDESLPSYKTYDYLGEENGIHTFRLSFFSVPDYVTYVFKIPSASFSVILKTVE